MQLPKAHKLVFKEATDGMVEPTSGWRLTKHHNHDIISRFFRRSINLAARCFSAWLAQQINVEEENA